MKKTLFLIVATTQITHVFAQEATATEAPSFWGTLWEALTSSYLAMGLLFSAIILLMVVLVLLRVVTSLAYAQVAAQQTEDAVSVEAKTEGPHQTAWQKLMQKLTDATPISQEKDVMTDHAYDGIVELDNNLPPWWLYGFYISIIWAFIFFGYYHLFGGPGQEEKYAAEIAQAEKAIEAYKANAADLIDENNVTLLADATALESGKAIFDMNCVACHGVDGGGTVGPNLTDDYFLHGGGIKNVFATIKNGVQGTAMINWKAQLKPREIQEVASYVLSLQGTTPMNPKAPEGDLWTTEATDTPVDGVGGAENGASTPEAAKAAEAAEAAKAE